MKKMRVLFLVGAICALETAFGAAPAVEPATRPAGSASAATSAATRPASASRPATTTATGPAAPANAPLVRVEANATMATHELGTVCVGSEHFVVYAVSNAREANIAIRQIRPDCECISAVQPPAYLAAGGETKITARFVAPNVNDVYGSELIVLADDAQRKIIRLRILCRVVPEK
jgi:hypothetical protein